MKASGDDPELEILLARAQAAPGLDRIAFRDPIARHGDAAILALAAWLTDPVLGAFAVRTIAAAASRGAPDRAIATLTEALPAVESTAVQRDILREIAQLRSAGRATTQTTQTEHGATIAGAPKADAEYSPPLTVGERELIAALSRLLPQGWTIFVRPHLDGDRPALALLHRERGAMVWDVRDIDLGKLGGSPKAYRDHDGVPYLDPIERINAVRQRLYREYLPGWAEAIDEDTHQFGVVRAGVYFPSGTPDDLARLQLLRPYEIVIGRGGLRGRAIGELVPNAFRKVEIEVAWYDVLFRRFSEYHPPTFGRIQPSKRQQELIDDPLTPDWRGLQGVAGSGKSLVLARRATRLAREGRRVLLVTYNLTLSNYCRGLVEDAPDRFGYKQLVVQHFHGLCHALLRNLDRPAPQHPAGLDRETDGPPLDPDVADARVTDHFDTRWPRAVVDALRKRGRPAEFTFDSILIDEAQDFGPSFFDVLAELLAPDGGVMLAFDRAQRLYARADGIEGRLDMRRVKKLNGTRRLRLRHANIASAMGASRRLPTERIELDENMPVLFSDDDAKWASVPDTAAALAVARDVLERWRTADGYRTDGTVMLVPSIPIGRALVALLSAVGRIFGDVFTPPPTAGGHLATPGGRGAWPDRLG